MDINNTSMGDLNKLSENIHQGNVSKGFYDDPKNKAEMLMLIVSELSEALEADRAGLYSHKIDASSLMKIEGDEEFEGEFKAAVKDTFEDEVADTIIRCLDLCGFLGIDIESHIAAKLRFNKLRPHKHGKKY